jgi:hypothetical protein
MCGSMEIRSYWNSWYCEHRWCRSCLLNHFIEKLSGAELMPAVCCSEFEIESWVHWYLIGYKFRDYYNENFRGCPAERIGVHYPGKGCWEENAKAPTQEYKYSDEDPTLIRLFSVRYRICYRCHKNVCELICTLCHQKIGTLCDKAWVECCKCRRTSLNERARAANAEVAKDSCAGRDAPRVVRNSKTRWRPIENKSS